MSVVEGSKAAGNHVVNVTVTLNPPMAQGVSITYHTGGGSASVPSDYLSASGALSFGPGESKKMMPITIVGDSKPEGNEFFNILIDSISNPVVLGFPGTFTILNDD